MAYGDLPMDAPLKPNKGLEGGACNRQSCQAEPALWYNHGMGKWYCDDCARDIGQDWVNKRDWDLRWKPECGHDQFETREMIDVRQGEAKHPAHFHEPTYTIKREDIPRPDRFELDDMPFELQKAPPYSRYRGSTRGGPYGEHPECKPKPQSESLKRMLGRKPLRRK